MQKIWTFKRFDSNFLPNLSNVLNILLASLFLQKIQIFKTFNFGTLFGRFDCGKSLEYFSHLLNISHICKDSDIQKIPLPENTILSLGQNLNITFSTSCHFTSHPLCLPHFTPLCATSLRPPFCLPHFTPLHATSLNLTFCLPHFMPLHATSPPILSTPLHATSCHFTPLHFTSHSVHLTSCHFTPLHFTSHSFHATSCHFTLLHFSSFLFASLHLTSPHLLSSALTSARFASLTTLCWQHFIKKVQLLL